MKISSPNYLALSLALIGGQASAADAPVETLFITATRLPGMAKDQAVNLTTISRRDIEHAAASNLPELLASVAGLSVRSLDATGNGSVDIRGFGAAASSNTLILLDGVKLNDNDLSSPRLTTIDLNNVMRVEIVKGGSVAYGGGTTGGVINIITREGVEKNGGDVAAKLGSYDHHALMAAANLGQDGLSLHMDVREERSDGYRQNSDNRVRAVNSEVAWRNAQVRLALQGGRDREDSRFAGARAVNPSTGLDLFRDDPRGTATPNDFGKTDSDRLALRGSGQLPDGGNWAVDLTRRNKTTEGFFDYGGGYSSADRRETTETRFSPRLAFPYAMGGLANELTAGIDWSHSDTEQFTGSTTPDAHSGDNTLKTCALWFENGTRFSESTRLTLGMRREYTSQQGSALQYDGSLVRADRDEKPVAWQLGLRQQLLAPLSLYAKLGRSYRLPNSDELIDNVLLRVQTSRDMEAGLEWRVGEMQGRLSAYHMSLDDEIAFQPYVNGFGQNINLSPTRRQGVELESRWRHGAYDIAANVSYTDARFRDGVYGGKDVTDKRVPLVARWQGNLSAGWQIGTATRLDAQWHVQGASPLDNDQINAGPELAGFATLDVKLSHAIGRWKVALSGQNLGDKQYATYGVKSTFGTNYNLYPNPGRRWLLTADYRY